MLITSKFPQDCTACGGYIPAGTRVSWVRGIRGAKHAACSEEGRVSATAVAESRAASSDAEIPCPSGLEYLPYQKAGIAWGLAREATLLGDEPGLGKTIQALGIINSDESIRHVLIVCPASLKLNWARECERWLVRPTTVMVEHGAKEPVQITLDSDTIDGVVIINYDILPSRTSILAENWDLVILDEAHFVKNEKSKRAQAVKKLNARKRIALTGTPIPNRPIELFPLLAWLAPKTWDTGSKGGFFRFGKRYCGAYKHEHGWDFKGATNLDELQERLRSTIMVRRLKSDVLTELPAKRRQVVELSRREIPAQKLAYQARWELLEEKLEEAQSLADSTRENEDYEGYVEAVYQLEKCRKLVFTEIADLRHKNGLAKVEPALDYLRNLLDGGIQKLVVFAHHSDVIEQLAQGLGEYDCVTLTGSTSEKERQAAVDRFQTDPECRVFIGSISAAGTGITLTAASTVVCVEVTYVPGEVTQAEDRCHRISQRDSVNAIHLAIEGTIDVTMLRKLISKQNKIDAALDTTKEA